MSTKGIDNKEHYENLNNLRISINGILNNYNYYPEEISSSRLVCINKEEVN